MLHQWESVAGNLELTTKLNTEIGHHKELTLRALSLVREIGKNSELIRTITLMMG